MKKTKRRWTMNKKLYLYLYIFMLFLLSSCAPPAVKEVKLIWPSPPEEPKIAYVASYHGESDFKKKGFFETILGETAFSTELQKPYGVTAYGD
ncbi:MAG: hypothetical protein M1610_07180, partial [Nitrospirae bacterium]|nr:hypothetical protein [Nitrospirota bacterium]